MMEWLREYGYLLLVFAAVCAVTAVIFFFAAKAYSKHAREFKKQDEEMKRLLALKEKYFNFTESTLAEASDSEILEGVALSYQLRLQKNENPEDAFEKLEEMKKAVYVLDVFCADADVGVFFKENGDILKKIILPALEKISMEDFAEKLKEVYDMFDIENEDVSYSEKKIEQFNSYMTRENIIEKIRLNAACFIKANAEALIN